MKELGFQRIKQRLIKILSVTKHETTCKNWWNVSPKRLIDIQIIISKRSSTFSATVILILFSSTEFFHPPLTESLSHYISFLGHLHCTLVHYLNLYSSICLIKYLLWLFVNGGGWNYTVQRSSSHKCGRKSCCIAFNAVVAAFSLDISVFLSSPYVPEVYPHHGRLLEGHLSHRGTSLTDIRPVRGG